MITEEQQASIVEISNEMLEKVVNQIKEKGTTKGLLKKAIFEATRRGYLSGLSFKSNREWRRKLEDLSIAHTSAYKVVKYATVGLEVECPGCGQSFVKQTTHNTCCQKSCKNKYWESLGYQTI